MVHTVLYITFIVVGTVVHIVLYKTIFQETDGPYYPLYSFVCR